MSTTVRVRVLGLDKEFLDIDSSFFEEAAEKCGGRFASEPPPFAAPCKDGLLFIYNLVMGPMDVRGASIALDRAALEEPINSSYKVTWHRANKPMSIAAAKKYFKFPLPDGQQS